MARGWVHTVFRGGLWINEVEEGGPLTKHERRDEAVAAGGILARELRTVHVVHSMSGAGVTCTPRVTGTSTRSCPTSAPPPGTSPTRRDAAGD